jgi:1,4-dihydroxy-2-naphthoate polyprenyltransferase
MIKLKTVLQSMRLPFLILTPVCVFLGLSTSIVVQPEIDYLVAFLILIGAISAHISVNTLNEYYDFKSGLDLVTEKTPFSGGSGALPDHPEMAGPILTVGIVSLLATVVIGLYLVLISGMQIMPVGLIGVILIVTYTQWINRSPVLCLIAPGLGFGTLMVMGTHVILTGEYSLLAWQLSLVPFFLTNNLLLLNQYPDIIADTSVGRKTFPIVFGVKKSNLAYAVFMLSAYLPILIYVVNGLIPGLCLIAFIPMLFSLFALAGGVKYSSNIGDSPQHLAANVAAAILTPLLLGIGLLVG